MPARQPWQKPGHRHWRLPPAAALAHIARDTKGTLDIGGAFGSRQPDLLRGWLDPLERTGRDRQPGLARYRRREHAGLIETPRPQAPPMQRHRDQRIRVGKKFAPSLTDPAAHHWCEVKPIAIFESMHQRPRNLVEAQRRASAIIGRQIGNRLHRQNARSGVVDEGCAEPLAIRSCDEGEFGPAYRTRPRPSIGSRQAAQSCGSARSSTRRRAEWAAPATRLNGAGRILLSDNMEVPRYRSRQQLSSGQLGDTCCGT